jgi:uncharacterized membrane protein
MDKQRYKQVQAGVASITGLVVAVSVVLQAYEVAIMVVALGIMVLFSASRQLDEVLRDERNAMIQYKASTMTLSILTVSMGLAGVALVELSYMGYESVGGYGQFLAYLAMGIMALNNIFTWHYGRQLGD